MKGTRTMRRRAGIKGALLLVGVFTVCGALLFYLDSSPSDSLLAVATKLPPIKNLLVGEDVVYRRPPGDQEVLVGRSVFVRDAVRPNAVLPRHYIHVSRRNVMTGEETPLPGLDPYFARDYMAVYVSSFSPDAQWLLCGLASPGTPKEYGVCWPDGTHFQRCPASSAQWQARPPRSYAGASVQWLPDSRHWVEFTVVGLPFGARISETLTVHDVQTPQAVQTIPIALSSPLFTEPSLDFDRRCKVLSPTRMLMALEQPVPGGAQNEKQSVILELDLAAGGALLRTHVVSLPRHVQLSSRLPMLRFSRSGKQMMWVIAQVQPDPLGDLLHRFLPAHTAQRELCEGVWVGRSDGTHVRALGAVRMHIAQSGIEEREAPTYEIGDADWMMDEKRVWFCYADFRTVPVD
jgi:hypothetical protein